MLLESLLTQYIFDFSILHIIIIDDVTSMFNTEDQCRKPTKSSKFSVNIAEIRLILY